MGWENINQDIVYKLYSKEEKIKKCIADDEIVSLVDTIIFNAIMLSASDIHLEQIESGIRVRYRIDGILYDRESISSEKKFAVLSRLKIISDLDIAQKRVPQDGKVCLQIVNDSNIIDLRVSTYPSIYGEKMVIRILNRSENCIKLESLGFEENLLKQLYKIIHLPYGFFLVTGPTGSGKTTTLYAILSQLNDSKKNIITIEDPVEYNLDGITQSQVNNKAGFNFENSLRSILRQDPDIIMVGEIRDKQTAQIAIEAALTGHLVFSTLHTNDSVGAIIRLLDMGIEPFLINASLSGVLAQRLVRKLCNNCKKEHFLNSDNMIKKVYSSQGCDNCFNLGTKGRTGIFEFLLIDDIIRSLIIQRKSNDEIKKHAIQNGMQTLYQNGLCKVKAGDISLEELLRVVG